MTFGPSGYTAWQYTIDLTTWNTVTSASPDHSGSGLIAARERREPGWGGFKRADVSARLQWSAGGSASESAGPVAGRLTLAGGGSGKWRGRSGAGYGGAGSSRRRWKASRSCSPQA